jgi:hypothetical protein
MLYSILTDNIISEYIISGICSINRNINHYAIPYVKNNIVPELHEIKIMMMQIINTIKHSQHHTIY